MNRFVCIFSLVVSLSACGGDEIAPVASAPAAQTASAPAAQTAPQPTAVVVTLSAAKAAAPVGLLQSSPDSFASLGTAVPARAISNPFAGFDFKGGTAFPARAAVSVEAVNVPVGATEAFVPIRLNRATPNTVILRVVTRNGSGALAGIERRHFQRVATTIIFRPGDPLEQTVRIPLINMDAGRHFEVILPQGVIGGEAIDPSGRITAVAGAAPGAAKTAGFRPARIFVASGMLSYQLDPAKMKWSDAGAVDAWRTRLPHGRTQPGNGESGLYLDPALHQSPLPPFAIERGEVVIRSQQLASLISHGGAFWRHGAAVLTGQRTPATQIQYGQYEWTALMPNRRGGWPALWLLPTSGWPPEIDVYEGFGYSSGWKFDTDISANIHGGDAGKRTFTAGMQVNAAQTYALSGFDRAYHRYAVDIAPDFITWFVDGKETYQTVNPFRGTTWFPLMNVAVKHIGEYTGGTAEMRVRSFAVWKVPG